MEREPIDADREAMPDYWRLVSGACDGTLSSTDCARLDAVLAADENARELYAFYLSMHGELMWHFGEARSDAEKAESPPLRASRTLGFLGGAWEGASGLFSQVGSWSCLAYLIALAVYGLLLLAAASFRVADPVDVAARFRPPVPAGGRQQRPGLVLVGRISVAHKCHCWVDQATMTDDVRAVPLGRTICLLRGVMEITYYTGAKVVLRSPCEYRVISANSGFLLRGNVTVLVEKGAGATDRWKKGRRFMDPASASLTEPTQGSQTASPLCFIVRTPNALLASQGGEFTVGVNDEGQTLGFAVRGLVKSVTSRGTEERFVDVPKGSVNSPAGPDESKCCLINLDDTRMHDPSSGPEKKRG
jgi:hypothetical protein